MENENQDIGNRGRYYLGRADQVSAEARNGNVEGVRILCFELLTKPDLPLFYRASYCLTLGQIETTQAQYYAEQALLHFQRMDQQHPEGSPDIERYIEKCLEVLETLKKVQKVETEEEDFSQPGTEESKMRDEVKEPLDQKVVDASGDIGAGEPESPRVTIASRGASPAH